MDSDETKSVSTRKIANGYLISEYGDGPGGYKETYSPTKPMISVDKAKTDNRSPSSLAKALKTLNRST